MPRIPKLGYLFLLPLAGACASGLGGGLTGPGGSSTTGISVTVGTTGTTGVTVGTGTSTGIPPGETSTGFAGTGGFGSTGFGGAGVGGGASNCGLGSSDPTCNACLDASCCSEALACANDPTCVSCLGSSTPPASCNSNAALQSLGACLQGSCSTQCGGGAGGAGGGGSTGPGGATGAGGALSGSSTGTGGGMNCGLMSSVPACNTCLDASCCSEALACANDMTCVSCLGPTPPASCATDQPINTLNNCLLNNCDTQCGGGSSSSSSSTGSSSGGAPTDCTGADGHIGCCDGNVLWYCTNSGTLTHKTCPSGQVCGWNASMSYYGCGSNPGADPSGTYPIACGP